VRDPSFEWHQYQWPWVTSTRSIQVWLSGLRLYYNYGRRSIKWCHLQWPWTNPNPVFFDAKYLTNGYRYGHSYYRKRIGNRTQAFEWHQFQRPWVTSRGHSRSLKLVSLVSFWRRSVTWTRRDFNFNLRPPSTGKIFVWSLAFLPEPSSVRYSSAPSITTVWSNYQTSYNDFFEVYITETVTLSPNIQMVLLTSSVQ